MIHLCRRLSLAAGLLLAAVTVVGQPSGANAADIKRVTDRYNLTHTRISALLDQRLHPTPLPAIPPNPFYQSPPGLPGDTVTTPIQAEPDIIVPEAADLSDIDTLRKYAATLKISGVIVRNGVPNLTINNIPCKVGDIITVGPKDRPIYLKLAGLNSADFTLELNQASLNVPLRL
jgi:hypothetical protein